MAPAPSHTPAAGDPGGSDLGILKPGTNPGSEAAIRYHTRDGDGDGYGYGYGDGYGYGYGEDVS